MIGASSGTLGARHLGNGGAEFRLWAPFHDSVELHIVSPQETILPMEPEAHGYHRLVASHLAPGCRYFYRLNGREDVPDPCSRFQPDGVHGPSELVSWEHRWTDDYWRGVPLSRCVFYEIHVGTFTAEGTFDAIIPRLTDLEDLGVTAIELMPVAQFPGDRNWGYDGVYPFAVQNSYGGPEGLARLVDAAHARGLAVVLDVVYNHLGPEGNYLGKFGPYFTDRYRTPWGEAINFDGADSDPVRRYFLENALYWIDVLHIDGLRLDAVHAILDSSPRPFLADLASEVHRRGEALNRCVHLFPESAANEPRLVRSPDLGGLGLDAQWNDDFHHSLRVLLTGEKTGYYVDYGEMKQLAKAVRQGFVYTGEYSSYRRRRHGASSQSIPPFRFVVFSQNHDQVGNRMRGDRLSTLVDTERLKLAAAIVLLSPNLPLLFMGEEYGEVAPFPYFVSHSDSDLVEAVRRGRRQEFSAFEWKGEPPDPQDEATFQSAKLNPELGSRDPHRQLRSFYAELLRLRRSLPPLAQLGAEALDVGVLDKTKTLSVRCWSNFDETLALFHFGESPAAVPLPWPSGRWRKEIDSADPRWAGPGSLLPPEILSPGEVDIHLAPWSAALFSFSGGPS